MPRFLVFALAVTITPLAASEIWAQSVSAVSIEATIGLGKGWTGGEYLGNRPGVAAVRRRVCWCAEVWRAFC
jgi:hypothetical protein